MAAALNLSGPAGAEPVPPTTRGSGAYETPLAGEPFKTVFMGQEINIPARDRNNLTALTLGGTVYFPHQGDNMGSPLFALYLKRKWDEEMRLRAVISIFVNDVQFSKGTTGSPLEFVALFSNDTIPGGQTEIINNTTQNWTSATWGTIDLMLGPGLRYQVAPNQTDNDLRLQLLGRAGYFYARRNGDTGKVNDYPVIDYRLPSSTWTYGMKFRGRYDGLRRNLLELPHKGLATGFDIDYVHRANWDEPYGTFPGNPRNPGSTRNYAQFAGYLIGATPIPGLSEKDVLLASIHGGGQDTNSSDRWNSFRIGGGPLPGETDDLCRVNYPGTMFNSILVSNYTMAAVEYRRELTFFAYLHLRGSFIWAQQANYVPGSTIQYRRTNGQAFTAGIDTGFLWNSSLYLDYSWESGFVRNGAPGSGIILIWNKSF
jgi:hypothetical protein